MPPLPHIPSQRAPKRIHLYLLSFYICRPTSKTEAGDTGLLETTDWLYSVSYQSKRAGAGANTLAMPCPVLYNSFTCSGSWEASERTCPSRRNFTLRLELVIYIVTSTNRLYESTTCDSIAVSLKKSKTFGLETTEEVAYVAISLQFQGIQQTTYDWFPQRHSDINLRDTASREDRENLEWSSRSERTLLSMPWSADKERWKGG